MNLTSKLFLSICLLSATTAHANSKIPLQYFNSPETAPQVKKCKGNQYCNAFYALSQYWQSIPNNFRYDGEFDIKQQAKKGDGYGLWKGFSLSSEMAVNISSAGEEVFYSGGSKKDEAIFARGLAVLLYIEQSLNLTQ